MIKLYSFVSISNTRDTNNIDNLKLPSPSNNQQKKEEDEQDGNVSVKCNGYWTAWLEVTPTEMKGAGDVHVRVFVSYCKALPDIGGGTYQLLDFNGSVYLDGKEISTLNSVRDGTTLSVGDTRVVDEFDWPLTVGTHNITLKIRNTSGLQQYETTKMDSVSIRVFPLDYPLRLVDTSCSNLNFNFESSNYYTQGNYVSPLECTLNFRNVGDTQIYVKELSADISVSPPDLEEAIFGHKTVSVNENVKPSEVLTIQIQGKAVTTDRQMLLRVDGTTATFYIDYTIKGMIRGVNRVVGRGVSESVTMVHIDKKDIYLECGIEGAFLVFSFTKISKISGIANKAKTVGGLGIVLKFINLPEMAKNYAVSHDDEAQKTIEKFWDTLWGWNR